MSIENLLNELRNMKNEVKSIPNSKEMWSQIGSGADFSTLGFQSKEELDAWIENNPYANL